MNQGGKRKLVVSEFVTLDGVMQAPGLPDEDREGGFEHGGWQTAYFDELFGREVTETLAASDALLLGRKTYDIFAGYWPKSKEPLAAPLNQMAKYVVSRTRQTLGWQNSRLIQGDVAPEIAKLKGQAGKNILVFGSGELVKTLMRHDLVDDIRLMIHPLVLGKGKRLFDERTGKRTFALAESKVNTKGVLALRYTAGSQQAA